ncbi:hypothetical protein CLTEP_12700 [Clostridium tepidiprofundi DSM 19306]|uniref:Flagellar protein FliT n=1 Tax=Clostridium tepidiprofundi DSM 19306 TaxID=1121338 RepID=A0A151B4H3_9CLOT|nr:flagellar protein FliT [Clostridium tepidiprofundi]KYH34805.1 hypothetical protein CLTEP_12700 [Clostridium tepidiprofundi DSM 19306]
MLKVMLQQYKELTLKCIDAVNEKEFDNLLCYLDKRQELIENISDMSYSNKEFKYICIHLDILELDKKLKEMVVREKLEIKSRINGLTRSKKAYSSYNGKSNNMSILKKMI